MMGTKIEWATETLSPFKGCSKVSEGCAHCYAERMARRQKAMGTKGYEGVIDKNGWTGRVNFVPEVLDQLAKWKKPRRIFINSMSDTFHERVGDKAIEKLFRAMAENSQHVYYVLTKRPENIPRFIVRADLSFDHIWLGVTVESQKHVDRIAMLRKNWNGNIFVSAEPLLEHIDLGGYRFDWLIVGGESGHGARPMHPAWVRSLRDQALQARVPFFFKQWGEWAPDCLCGRRNPCKTIDRPQPGTLGCMFRCGKKAAGRMLDGREWNQIPE